MSRIIKVKNNMITGGTWVGVSLPAGAYLELSELQSETWAEDAAVLASVGSGDLVVNKGTDVVDDLDPVTGWKWITGNTLPLSDLGDKLAVHPSTKPQVPGKEFYLVWTGSGDDIVNGLIGEGDLLAFDIKTTDTELVKEIHFDPQFGDVYVHEGYAKWYHDMAVNPGSGDYMSATIVAGATALQTVANLDYELTNNWVKLAAGGPGTGTHGFAASPILVPRSFTKDGDWDFDGVNLTPNMTGTGLYKISDIERTVHKYINRIPMCNSSNGYDRLTSDESAYLPAGYFIRVTATNVSGSDWNCAFMFEVYREQTATA